MSSGLAQLAHSGRDRRVRRLRLTCQQEEHAQRGRTFLADALRTASLGDEGRVVVIRSLHLGRLSPHASATEWSLRLEQRVRAARADARFAETADASTADSVWFPNEIEVWLALALRAARGTPCPEWFWPPAATGWSPRLSAAETLRLAFRRLAASGGLTATLVLARRLAREGRLLVLLRALAAEDVATALPGLDGFSQAPRDDSTTGDESIEASTPELFPRAWRAVLSEFLRETSPGDSRMAWLVAAALFAELAAPPSAEEIRRLVWQRLTRLALALAERDASEAPPGLFSETAASEISVREASEKSLPEPATSESSPDPEGVITAYGGLFFLVPLFTRLGIAELPDAGAAAWRAMRLVLERVARPSPPERRSVTGFEYLDGAKPVADRRSGNATDDALLALLPLMPTCAPAAFVLPRLFVPGQFAQLARWRGNWRVLFDATGRLPLAAWQRGTPVHSPLRKGRGQGEDSPNPDSRLDPLNHRSADAFVRAKGRPRDARTRASALRWDVHGEGFRENATTTRSFPLTPTLSPSAGERESARKVLRATDLPTNFDPLAVALALGAHRLSRRQSGLGLKSLVRRPAQVSITDTHIDVFFRPGEADARIRRAALDVDPGWVPWLGRVVSFHYTRKD